MEACRSSGSAGRARAIRRGLRSTHFGFIFNYFELLIAAIVGAAVGAALGVAFRDWRMIVALAVAGAVGFSVGNLPADFIRFSIPIIRQLGQAGSIAITGVIGGAALGVTLGYLESRRLAEE
jgi:hypothetical protein